MNKQHALVLALLVSVAVNLLIAGIVIGRAGGPPGAPPPMDWAAREMDPDTRSIVRRRMREQQGAFRSLRAETGDAASAVRRAISAEDYNPQALAAALARMRDVTGRYQQLVHDNLVEVSKGLPREQRIALARAALQRQHDGRKPPRAPEQRR